MDSSGLVAPNMSPLAMIRRGLALPQAERSGFVKAYVALGVTDLTLRRHGFQQAVERVEPLVPGAAEMTLASMDVEGINRVNQYVRWIKAAARFHLVNARCLHESLTLHQWLRQDGLPSELRIGVRLDSGQLGAHAWVELFGQVVNDSPAYVAEFRPLTGLQGQPVTWLRSAPFQQSLALRRA